VIQLIWDSGFEKKLEGYIKKHPEKAERIRNRLEEFEKDPFATTLKNHKLSGKLKELRAIVVDYDCRIVFQFIGKSKALLVSIGTHEEVY